MDGEATWQQSMRDAWQASKDQGCDLMIMDLGWAIMRVPCNDEQHLEKAIAEGERHLAEMSARPVEDSFEGGDHFVRTWGDLVIFGRITTWEELAETEGQDEDHWAWFQKIRVDADSRGYRYGKCHSTIEPIGEYGDTHVSQMVKITGEQFELARVCGWDPDSIALRPNGEWIVTAVSHAKHPSRR